MASTTNIASSIPFDSLQGLIARAVMKVLSELSDEDLISTVRDNSLSEIVPSKPSSKNGSKKTSAVVVKNSLPPPAKKNTKNTKESADLSGTSESCIHIKKNSTDGESCGKKTVNGSDYCSGCKRVEDQKKQRVTGTPVVTGTKATVNKKPTIERGKLTTGRATKNPKTTSLSINGIPMKNFPGYIKTTVQGNDYACQRTAKGDLIFVARTSDEEMFLLLEDDKIMLENLNYSCNPLEDFPEPSEETTLDDVNNFDFGDNEDLENGSGDEYEDSESKPASKPSSIPPPKSKPASKPSSIPPPKSKPVPPTEDPDSAEELEDPDSAEELEDPDSAEELEDDIPNF